MEIFKKFEMFFTKMIHRDAKTGKFVSKQYVIDNPETTITEERKIKKSLKKFFKDFFSTK